METKKKQTTENEEVKEKKKQAISTSYLLNSLKRNIEKLKELELITTEEELTLSQIRTKAIMKWIS